MAGHDRAATSGCRLVNMGISVDCDSETEKHDGARGVVQCDAEIQEFSDGVYGCIRRCFLWSFIRSRSGAKRHCPNQHDAGFTRAL